MKKIIKKMIVYLLHLVFIPHIFSYYFSSTKTRLDIRDDIQTMNSHLNIDYPLIPSLVYHLLKNKYYRNIFYNRIGWCSFFCKYFPVAKNFFPCKNIGGGVYPAHPYSTVLNAKSIGKNCSFRQCTTLGNKRDGECTNGPTLGDNVTIGANVCIIGDISIGNNVQIGAGAVVVKNVPDNAVVVGNPARVVKFVEL